MPGAIAEKPWMAISKEGTGFVTGNYAIHNRSHPCVLDPGNPCRDDGAGFGLLKIRVTPSNPRHPCSIYFVLMNAKPKLTIPASACPCR